MFMLDLCKIIEIKKSVESTRSVVASSGAFAFGIVNCEQSGQNFNLLMRGLNLDLAWYSPEWGLATCLHQFEF